jgi:Spy/CpxP family protein refolding chaperone
MVKLITRLCFAASLACSPGIVANPAPYAGDAGNDIKALTAEEQAALRVGKGMGFAKAAELNGYPGPAHILELASELHLSDAQLDATRRLFARMQKAAQADGAALIEAERVLDRLYAKGIATAENVDAQLAQIEALRAHLRGVHLNAHLEQSALLTPDQRSRYRELRGYGTSTHSGH